jgi:hypothetical protein
MLNDGVPVALFHFNPHTCSASCSPKRAQGVDGVPHQRARARALDMSLCTRITNAGLAHLAGIHSLGMSDCPGITDAGLAHLVNMRFFATHAYVRHRRTEILF